ncbi:translocation protein TolB [endosymbiont of Acanthamoeba sp. UWC8]|uniref:Tol-Pal system beta propeller repeat protein TolB n=1 Tax=endosymbiont of Acanthamoeba sp. UWC8 TaxID=86106 RepID=UPI0004D0CBEB|nr:Tol-Pal system beta propeller repeat protein TolB [endosymbiont of Acanthamoeba sp. UWC8]AIF80799.1 translocation protein TolB [endosymbiont of Acanthamoeba sp. UWC8]
MLNRVIVFCSLILLQVSIAQALVEIDITRGNVEAMPIAVDSFKGTGNLSKEIGEKLEQVISNDLENSGLFRPINKNAFLENITLDKAPTYSNWRRINATSLISGQVEIKDSNHINIKFKMWDPYNEIQLEGGSYTVSKNAWRRVAHKIADVIYKRLTGEEGYFDTRILFIAESGTYTKRIKKLAIMDQDGANLKLLSNGSDLVITPRFDPNSQRAIFMSYKNLVPKVYMLDLETGTQKLVGDFPGMSFAPRFSPDGNYAIMSVAKSGTTNIFEIDLRSNFVKQLTYDRAVINTSPSYSPDGTKITFNSDRGGSRQLYVMDRDGSNIKRISFGGGSYATPVWSPRGDYIAFTKMQHRKFYIGVMRVDGSGERLLTSSWLDEGPTWSPNGRVIMFERQKPGGKSNIYAIDITGYHERMIETPGDASDPAWSPILK